MDFKAGDRILLCNFGQGDPNIIDELQKFRGSIGTVICEETNKPTIYRKYVVLFDCEKFTRLISYDVLHFNFCKIESSNNFKFFKYIPLNQDN